MARVLSAGIILVNRSAAGCRYLVLRAYDYWDFPKGLVEAGEEPMAAARRELEEETGLSAIDFRWGADYRETAPYGRGKVARYYVAMSTETKVVLADSAELGRPEHHEYRWVGLDEARVLLAPRVVPILEWADQVTGCRSGPEHPGVTPWALNPLI